MNDTDADPVIPRYYALPMGVFPPREPIPGLRFCVDSDGRSRCVRVEQPTYVRVAYTVASVAQTRVRLSTRDYDIGWTADGQLLRLSRL